MTMDWLKKVDPTTYRRSADIYIGEDRIVIQHNDSGIYGGHFGGTPLRTLDHSSPVKKILTELKQALTECALGVPVPQDLKAVGMPLLAATGEKTWHAITRSFACVHVEEEKEELVFSPWVPEKGSFWGTGSYWRSSKTSLADIAEAFRAAAAVAIEAQNLRNTPPLT